MNAWKATALFAMTEIERLLWRSKLTAEMNTGYWGYLSARNSQRDVWFKVFIAVISSGTVGAWAFWAAIPIVWKALSGLSALTSIVVPLFKYSDKAKLMADLGGKWSRLANEYRGLWAELTDTLADSTNSSEFKRSKAESVKSKWDLLNVEIEKMAQNEASIPLDKKVRLSCFEEVKRANGLS